MTDLSSGYSEASFKIHAHRKQVWKVSSPAFLGKYRNQEISSEIF
jgi:hypothetical protein